MLRIGLVHYNTAEEVDRLLAALRESRGPNSVRPCLPRRLRRRDHHDFVGRALAVAPFYSMGEGRAGSSPYESRKRIPIECDVSFAHCS